MVAEPFKVSARDCQLTKLQHNEEKCGKKSGKKTNIHIKWLRKSRDSACKVNASPEACINYFKEGLIIIHNQAMYRKRKYKFIMLFPTVTDAYQLQYLSLSLDQVVYQTQNIQIHVMISQDKTINALATSTILSSLSK